MKYAFDRFQLVVARGELVLGDRQLPLEPRMCALLCLLVENHDRLVSKSELLEKVWDGRVVSDTAISTVIKSTRKVLGDDGTRQHFIRTVRGRGYRFEPPVRIIAPGRCYRRDTADATHSANFHQVEGLYVADNVSMADLKGDLSYFAQKLMGPDVQIRFRPHFFPFTEPSVEVDFSCHLCAGDGCRVCKHSGWIEILGAGMVDPEVFKAVGYDPDQVTGYAFGMGIERIAMILFGIEDIRNLYENDVRFLSQFG